MSFLYPTAFWFALTLPVVVACYLLKRRRKTELVPASLLWNRFMAENQANAPFQKLKRHILLILQLCMLLLAILALSAPFFRTHRFASEMLIVLIDTSASMQSTDVAPSRMHQAHEAVEELIATMDGNDQMMLIAAGNPTRVIQSATSSHTDLRRALKHLQSTDTATRLSEGLKLAATLAEGIDHVQIHLFTDGAVSDLTDTTLTGIDLVYHPLGIRGNNVGIVSMDIRPNPDDVSSRAIFTSIANYSNASKNLILELRFEDQLLEARAMTIEAGATSSVTFIAPQERAGVFDVSFQTDDDLAMDNQAAKVSLMPQPIRVLLVTSGNRFLERAIASAPQVELAVTSQWEPSAAEADIVILDDIEPERLPDQNLMAIHVFPDAWFDEVKEILNPAIVDWQSTHPIMRFSQMEGVSIASTGGVLAPPWAMPVVESAQSPLILAGEDQGRRVVWLGFRPLDSTWPLRVSFPIFIQNAMQWLHPGEAYAERSNIQTGEALIIPLNAETGSPEILPPNQPWQPHQREDMDRQWIYNETSKQGIYRFRQGQRSEVFSTNLLDPSESDNGPRETLQLGNYGQMKPTRQERAQLQSWRWILLVALGILMLEWFIYHKRSA